MLKLLEEHLQKGDYLVASGKSPPGVPANFHVMVSKLTDKIEAKLVLDTSGKALLPSMEANIFMMKPNLGELGALCWVNSISAIELESLAKNLFKENTCEILVVSLATKEVMAHILAPTVHQKSTIGAGDSMVAGMVLSLMKSKSLNEMVKYGVACGTTATIHSSTQLCSKEDADGLYEWINTYTVKKTKKSHELI